MKLNKSQLEAINTKDGYVLVLAGAGTGKTTTITERMSHLVADGVAPENILAITFTNKAANEMKMKLKKLLKNDFERVNTSTIHALCLKILREEVENTKYRPGFSVISGSDQKNIVKKILKENNSVVVFAEAFEVLSYLKTNNMTSDGYKKEHGKDDFFEVVKKYEEYMMEYNLMDFDDLINNTLTLFKTKKKVLSKYQNQFLYVHVDEYQDTSKVQNELIEILASKNNNLFVVGDDDQSIYSWRGADIDGILHFDLRHEAKVIKLEENYRSTKNIINFSNEIIRNNIHRHEKALTTKAVDGELVQVKTYDSEYKEAKRVAENIKAKIDAGVKPNDIAVLYRINKLSRHIEDQLTRMRVPHNLYGGVRFYDQKEIKEILAYIKILIDNNDDIAFEKIINVPKRQIGAVTYKKLSTYAKENEISCYYASASFGNKEMTALYYALERVKPKFDKNMKKGIEELLEIIKYKRYLKTLYSTSEVEEKMDDINSLIDELCSLQKESSEKLLEFINDISVYASRDIDKSGVNLLTIHAAKGMEYNHVYLIGAKNGIMPIENSNLEEERRLMYVATTRAKKTLSVSFEIGSHYKIDSISPFIHEAGEQYICYYDVYGNKVANTTIKMDKKKAVTIEAEEKFKKGDWVKHKKFGKGEIKKIDKDGSATIKFENNVTKTIIPNSKILKKVKG